MDTPTNTASSLDGREGNWSHLSPQEIVRRTRCQADDWEVSSSPTLWRQCCDLIQSRLGPELNASTPLPDQDGAGGGLTGGSDLLDALQRVAKAAKAMPRETPAPGGAGTMHDFSIEAGVVWDLDRALDHLATIQAGYSTGKYRAATPKSNSPLPPPPVDQTMTVDKPCHWGGGNDIIWCSTCGAEYAYAKGEERPACPRTLQDTGEVRT
jgi:hypothetical protein